jgi:hypothetical protein
MANGFSVDLSALEQASAGVNGTLDQVDQLAVSAISHNPAAFGHAPGTCPVHVPLRAARARGSWTRVCGGP